MNNEVFGKTVEHEENTEISNLQQQTQKEVVYYHNPIITQQNVFGGFVTNRNEKNKIKNE